MTFETNNQATVSNNETEQETTIGAAMKQALQQKNITKELNKRKLEEAQRQIDELRATRVELVDKLNQAIHQGQEWRELAEGLEAQLGESVPKEHLNSAKRLYEEERLRVERQAAEAAEKSQEQIKKLTKRFKIATSVAAAMTMVAAVVYVKR